MIQNIDFLPSEYRQRRQIRQKTIWRRAVLAVFLALIVAGTLRQRHTTMQLKATRARLHKRVRETGAQLQSADELRQQIKHLDAEANLVTMLRVRIPPTRIVATVAGCLPEFVTLTELRSKFEVLESSRKTSARANIDSTQDSSGKVPVEHDLDWLEQQNRQTALFVQISGVAPDDVAVSRYLAALERTGTFDDVRLLYTDRFAYQEHSLRSFGIRLRMRKPAAPPVSTVQSQIPDPHETGLLVQWRTPR